MTKAPTINAEAAEQVDASLRSVVEGGMGLARLMYESEGWRHLGSKSYQEWVAGLPRQKWSIAERREQVQTLYELGMSQREIAATVGVDPMTVNADIRVVDVENSTPRPPRRSRRQRRVVENSTLAEAAASVPTTDAALRATVDGLIGHLQEASVAENEPVTDEKVAHIRRLLDAADEMRQDWLPYMGENIRRIR